MKKFFYLMSVACLMMAASCEKDGNGDSQTPEAPVITVPAGEKTAGGELLLPAEGVDKDAKFYLKSEEEKIELGEVVITDAGVSARLPYNLGEYTLIVEQNNTTYELGEITIAITGLASLPDAVEPGDEITIVGSGFAPDAKISIGGSEISVTPYVTGVKAVVPADVTAGTTDVFVKQEGTEQKLGSLAIETQKVRRRGLTIKIDPTFSGAGDLVNVYTCHVNYNAGKPVSFVSVDDNLELENSYSITVSGNVYTFTNENSDGASWAFTVDNGRVVSFKYGNEATSLPWTYNGDGQLISFHVDGDVPYKLEYENGNYNYEDMNSYSEELIEKSDEIDFLAAFDLYNTINSDSVITDPLYAAMVLGWAGKPSKNKAETYQGIPVIYTDANASGYVPSVNFMGMMEVICDYK